MEIINLEPGKCAADDKDRVIISRKPSGKFEFNGVIAAVENYFHNAGGLTFENEDDALGAALQWAESHDPAQLYIERHYN